MATLTGEKKMWPEIFEKVNEERNLYKLDWQRDDLRIGSVLHTVAEEAKVFLINATTVMVSPRNDYGIVCKLAYFFLGAEIPDFKFHPDSVCFEKGQSKD